MFRQRRYFHSLCGAQWCFFRARQVLFFPLPGKVGYLSEATAGHFSAPRFDASGLTGRTTLSDGDIPQILSLALDSNGGIRK
jgi:hypothetical protein